VGGREGGRGGARGDRGMRWTRLRSFQMRMSEACSEEKADVARSGGRPTKILSHEEKCPSFILFSCRRLGFVHVFLSYMV
jgi:hypothetical protein